MGSWMKTVLAVVVVLLPGGLVALLALGLGRSLRSGWRAASAQAEGRRVPVRQVLAGLTFRGIVREAFIS